MVQYVKLPLAYRARSLVAKSLLFAAELTGKYERFSRRERQVVPGRILSFSGEVPLGHPVQQYHSYAIPRPPRTEVQNLIYTPRGMAWVGGVLHERYSLCAASGRGLRTPKPDQHHQMEMATIVQTQTPVTYGDWVSEHLSILANAKNIRAPLLLPADFAKRSYVARDLNKLGIGFTFAEQDTLIKNAVVLHKTKLDHFWTTSEAEVFRQKFKLTPPPPRAGSILYLSRNDVVSDVSNRSYPSKIIENIITEMNGKIINTATATYEDYLHCAEDAETVVADHGSALFNMLAWSPKRVVEVFNDEWWNSCFMFVADSINVSHYELVRGENKTSDELKSRIMKAMQS